MALNLSQIQEHFKIFGKLIYMAQQGPTDAESYRKAVMGTIRQGVDDGNAAEYALHGDVLVPMENQVKSTINALAGIPTTIKSSMDTYLKKVVAVNVGLTASATPNAIVNAIKTDMVTASATVGQSGSNPNGFAMYFFTNYGGVELPQDGSPNVSEAWIDDDVV